MPVTVVIGGQFGSEGKGKAAHFLARETKAKIAEHKYPEVYREIANMGHQYLDQKTLDQLVGNADAQIVRLQQAGLIRADLPVPIITFLIGSLKIGIINVSELMGQEHMPSIEQLTEALSDLMRRWLEPEHLPADSAAGKQIMAEWLEQVNEITEHIEQES